MTMALSSTESPDSSTGNPERHADEVSALRIARLGVSESKSARSGGTPW